MTRYSSKREDLGSFVEDCGISLFESLRTEANYFKGSPDYTAISRYRSGSRRPPFGYVAHLAYLRIDRSLQNGDVQGAEQTLARFNQLIPDYYPNAQPFRSATDLARESNAFIRQRWGEGWQAQRMRLGGLRPLANLPDLLEDTVGYEDQFDAIWRWLHSSGSRLFLIGMDGAGKTTLAIKVGYASLHETAPPCRAVVWVSAKAQPDKVSWWEDILDSVLDVMRYRHAEMPLATKAEKVRAILTEQPILVILDNYNSMKDAMLDRWIHDIPVPSKVLLTTHSVPRHEHTSGVVVALDGLPSTASLSLIRRQAKQVGLVELASAPDGALLPLVMATAGNPLLIRLALDDFEYVGELVTAAHYASHREILARKWAQLEAEESRRMWMVTGFFDEHIAPAAIGATAGIDRLRLYDGLRELVRGCILSAHAIGLGDRFIYSIHPTVRSFAIRKLEEDPVFMAEARRRWADFYLSSAGCLIMAETPERYWNTSTDLGLEQLDLEWPNFVKVLSWAAELPESLPADESAVRDSVLVELMVRLVHYMDKRGRFRERLMFAGAAATAAARVAKWTDAALFRIDALGWTLMEERRYEEALEQIRTGMAIATKDLVGEQQVAQVVALGTAFVARCHLAQGNLDDAAEEIARALAIPCIPSVRNRVTMIAGEIAHVQGDYAAAERYFVESIEQRSHDRLGTIWLLGYNYLAQASQGAPDALAKAEEAFLRIQREQQELTLDGVRSQLGIAEVHRMSGRVNKALETARRARQQLLTLYVDHKLLADIDDFIRVLSDSHRDARGSRERPNAWSLSGMAGWLPHA